MRTLTTQRDLRIDLVRGIALLVLVTDHLPGNPLRSLMPVSWGLADMAEAFVLLSGVVLGFGISKRRTFRVCAIHRLRRAATLFIAYFVTAILLIAMVRNFQIGIVAETLPPHLLAGSWADLVFNLFALNGRVTHLCILLLYFWLAMGMIGLPDRIWRYPRILFLSSFLLYLAVQLSSLISLPDQFQDATYYNPFAWQLLFVTGAIYGNASDEPKKTKLNRAVIFPLALLVHGVLLLIVGLEGALPEFLIKKSTLGPFRYLHAISAAVILKEFLPKQFSTKWQRVFSPVFRCSEQSLWVYCGGSLLVVGLSKFMWQVESFSIVVLLNLLVWTGCFCIAWLASSLNHCMLMKRKRTI